MEPFADAALRAIEQFYDFAACAQNPRLRQKVRQQPAFRTRQIDAEAVVCSKQVAFGVEAHSGEGEISPSSVCNGPAAASHAHNVLYRLVQANDVDRCRNAIRRSSRSVIMHKRRLGIADDEDWGIGLPTYCEDCSGSVRR